jgi:predicted branched-subunit amino acid permease
VFMYVFWQISTLIGIIAGGLIEDPLKWGLDFSLIVTFIGMLVPMLKEKSVGAAVLASGAAALLLRDLPNKLGLMAAALIGVGVGMLAHRLAGKGEGGADASEE